MKLVKRKPNSNDFVCELTKDLDGITLLDHDDTTYNLFHHYLVIDDYTLNHTEDGIPIRVPGCTVGGLWIDENKRIINIDIGYSNLMKYPESVKEKINKYIGVKLEL